MENDRFILNRNSDVKVIYIGTGQFQLASGKWVDAILYKYRGVYKMMEASEFIRLADQIDLLHLIMSEILLDMDMYLDSKQIKHIYLHMKSSAKILYKIILKAKKANEIRIQW